jgi:hypothetical protein
MAQTITVQRGSGSWSGGATGNSYTLFTNGANYVRVIPQQLVFTRTNGSSVNTPTGWGFTLLHSVSGTIASPVAMMGSTGQQPSMNAIVAFTLAMNYTPSSGGGTSIFPANAAPVYTNQDYNASRTFENRPYNNALSNFGSNNYSTPLQQFYLGPSDVVKIATSGYFQAGKSASAFAGSYYYSFLLITES